MKQVELNDVGRIVMDAFGHLLDSPSWLRLHGPLCCWLLITYRCIQLWELPSAEGNCLAQVSALQFLLLLLLLSSFSHVRLCATPPGCPVPGILQARVLEWFAISFSNA